MEIYMNRISYSEVHFGCLSDSLADDLKLSSHYGTIASDHIATLQSQLNCLLAKDRPNPEAVHFIRLYLEACTKYPDAEVTCD